MLKAWAQPLRRQLFIAILLMLAPVFAAAIWLGLEEFRETVEELQEQSQLTARLTAAAVERELTGYDRMAQHLSSYPSVQNLDGGAVDLLRPQPPSVIDLVLVDRQGHVVARASASDETGESWAGLVQSVVHANGRVISALNVRASGMSYLSVAYPLHDPSGSVSGILAYCLRPDVLQDAIRESQLPAGSVIALGGPNGVRANPTPQEVATP